MSDERGFTIVEVLVAVTILTVGALGTLKGLDAAQRTSRGSERNQQAQAAVQRAIEGISARPWAALGLTAVPARPASVVAGSPQALITATGRLLIPADPADPAGATADGVDPAGEPFVLAGAAGVDPAPQPVHVGPTTGTLYRFVTRVDPCTVVEGMRRCPVDPAADLLRRITVAIVLDGSARDGVRAPVWASTVVRNPDAAPLDL